MNKLVVFFVVVALAYSMAAPVSDEAIARRRNLPALHQEEHRDDFGQYALRYITAEGIFFSERGRLIPTPDGKDHVMAVEGEFSYIGKDGKKYHKKYTGDFEGFQISEEI
ncbi:hypothetical protein ACJJTC_008817 [Scirpophaga incertulas]